MVKTVTSWLPGLAALLTILACSSPVAPGVFASENPRATAPSTAPSAASFAETVLTLTNAERRRAGLAELEQSPSLSVAAQLHADQMRAAGRMAHELPGAPYPRPVDRLKAASYPWQAYAENVAMGQKSEAEVMAAWMGSSGHRQNILNPRYTQLGIGVAVDEAGRPYYAQVFGQPKL
jgi:uncharacterized protein YkwD